MRRADRLGLLAPLVLLSVSLGGGACGAPPELRPDSLLVDSLGLTARDRVHTTLLTRVDGIEVTSVPDLVVAPGDRVSFESGDGFVHIVDFEADSLADAQRGWAAGVRLFEPPPLLSRGAHWVISFEGAPEGRFPYRVTANGSWTRGVVIVREGR